MWSTVILHISSCLQALCLWIIGFPSLFFKARSQEQRGLQGESPSRRTGWGEAGPQQDWEGQR